MTPEQAEAEFKKTIRGVHLAYDFRSGQLVGAAIRDEETWAWQIVPRETAVERQSREAGINFLTDLAAEVAGIAAAPTTGWDTTAELASDMADPWSIPLKLRNGAVQMLVYQLVPFHPMARALGTLG